MNASEALFHQPVAQAVAWALLHFVWQGALIAALTSVVLLALRRSAADIRYVVATIGLAMMLTLPIVTGLQKWQAVQSVTFAQLVPGNPGMLHGGAAPPATGSRSGRPPRSRPPSLLDRARVRVGVSRRADPSDHALRVAGGCEHPEPEAPDRMAVDSAPAHARRQSSRDSWQAMARRLARRLHLTRRISLLESRLVDVPTVVGWMKPVVLLPVSALAGLSAEQLEAILAHELAHIRRHDYLVNLLQTLVETLLFYHPAVWWLSGRIRYGARKLL